MEFNGLTILILYIVFSIIIIWDICQIIDWFCRKIKKRKQKETITLWMARDKNNLLCLHYYKPYCNKKGKWRSQSSIMFINSIMFPQVTFENSPVEIKLIK